MYYFHGWIGWADLGGGEARGGFAAAIKAGGPSLEKYLSYLSVQEIVGVDHIRYAVFTGRHNRPNGLDGDIDELLHFVCHKFPDAWGLVYDQDDENVDSPFANMFRVKVISRGTVTVQIDPFLSPVIPTVQDD